MERIEPQQQPDDDAMKLLNEAAAELVGRRRRQTGYPFDQGTNLSGFYRWLLETGLCDTTLISVGSPCKEAWDMLSVDEFERFVIDFLAKKYGFPEGSHWGFVTNGGTDGNMHGLYFGRKDLAAKCDKPPVLYVSSEAHYSVQKLGDVLDIETRVVGALPDGRMDVDDFRNRLDGSRPALVAIAVGGTFKGAIDDQDAIDAVLREVAPPVCYRHLDAALFGGCLPWLDDPAARAILNQKEKHFDSLAVSGHKFFAMNEPTGAFICRKDVLEHLNKLSVPYLDCVMPTISCSRSGFDVLKLYWRIATTKDEGFRREAAHALAMTGKLIAALKARGVDARANPWSNTVFFPRPADEIVHKYCLACSDGLSHVVVMQHFDDELVEAIAEDVAKGRRS